MEQATSFVKAKLKLPIDSALLSAAIATEVMTGCNVQRSNIGGWHSEYKLHLRDCAAFGGLSRDIVALANHLLTKNRRASQPSRFELAQFWFNVSQCGHWHAPHSHIQPETTKPPLENTWSGVFYFQAELPTGGEVSGGDLLLFYPEEQGRVDFATVKPENNLLVLFPSQVLHMVTPLATSLERISFAFNLHEVNI